jgi:two-component system, chemotaxis family, protein-glutamate methylesterase/glutaminase
VAPRPRDVVVVGASAGGVEALRAMAAGLPAALPASVLVVLHLPTGGTSALADILDRVGPLSASTARDGEPLEHGRIYTARPDHHLLVVDGTVRLSHGPTENGHRPAVNALFRSAAIARGAAVTGVLLSGVLDDGVAGLHAIAQRGGRVVVQDPEDALYRGMPENALRFLTPDHVVPATELGDVLAKITAEQAETTEEAPELMRWEHDLASAGQHAEGAEVVGLPSEFSCPDCDGVLSDIDGGRPYRCRVGHAWTAEALLAAQGPVLERALWTAVRTLEEKAALSRRMAGSARARGSQQIAERYEEQASESSTAAEVLRQQVTGQAG